MKLRELFIRLGVKADQDKLDSFDDAVDGLKDNLKDLVGWLAKVSAGIAGVVGAAGVVTQQTAEYGEEVLRNARSMAMSVERYQELKFGMDQLGASTDDFMDALSTLTDRAKDAEEGAVTYVREFERIGISVEELKGMQPGQIFERYVRGAVNAKDRTQAVTSAVRLLGDDLGRRIMPALTSSAESFEDFTVMAREAGIVLTEEQIVAAREGQHQWRLLKAAVVAFKRYLGMELMPMFSRLLGKDGFKGWFAANARLMKSGIDRFARFLAEEVEKLVLFVSQLNQRVGGMEGWIALLKDAFQITSGIILAITAAKIGSVLGSIVTVLKAITVASSVFYAKIAAVVAAISLILLLIEDVWVYMQGGESVVGELVDKFGEGATWLDSMVRLVKSFQKTWETTGPAVILTFETLWAVVKGIVGTLWNMLKGVLSILFAWYTMIFDIIGAWARFVEDVVSGKKFFLVALGDLMSAVYAALGDFVVAIGVAILQFFANMAGTMKWAFGAAYDWLVDKTAEFFMWVEQSIKSIGSSLASVFDLSNYSWGIGGDVGAQATEVVRGTTVRERESATNNNSSTDNSKSQKNINVNNPQVVIEGGDTADARRKAADEGFKLLFGDAAKSADAAFAGGER